MTGRVGYGAVFSGTPSQCPTPSGIIQNTQPMKTSAREFIRTTTTRLDEVLAALTQQEQHDLLDALAGEIEDRLDALVEQAEA